MNAIGMNIPLLQTSSGQSVKSQESPSNGNLFRQILSERHNPKETTTANTDLSEMEMDEKELPEELREILSRVLSGEQTIDTLVQDSINLDSLSDWIGENHSDDLDMNTLIKLLEGQLSTEESDDTMSAMHSVLMNQMFSNRADLTPVKPSYMEIIAEFESLLSQMDTKEDASKVAPKILELLRQWTALEKNSVQVNDMQQLFKNNQSKEQMVWKDLIQSFQKRDQLSAKQLYNSDAKVTNKDVTRWLEKAFENHGLTERVSLHVHTGTTMSKLEQYAIHINQSQGAQPANQQLLDQFENIIKSSKFLAKPNGTNQLSITIQPHNLGEMRIRLLQVNGEMTVKIMVTTQAAKEMLESNTSQLRNMFSPHQVVIEKQEMNTQQGQLSQKEQNSDNLQDNNDSEQSNHPEQESSQHSEDDFETQFRELLMNEKV
ncbi:flagellar hook-length control protein FliK [Oceanobacillus salinisoli]|uniref:flagellar hook-length control protein FliK n=1 Tax=Oceanobacillus salinisoli TaxID=2678611 RepID=UPI0012E26148|nr:flagellar hook-length control protein FliK [Oceanobacillus salinisoli]